MLDYYRKELEKSKTQLELAKIGFEKKAKELGDKLSKGGSIDEAIGVVETLNHYNDCIEELKSSVQYHQDRFNTECNKPENKRAEAKEILFGGKNNG